MVILLVVMSIIVNVLRYYQYSVVVDAMNETYRAQLDASSSEDIKHGMNFPPDQKTVDEIPHPQDLYVPLLTIVPGKSMIYYPWILITSSFVEQNIVSLLFSITVILYGGRYCEHVWGSIELFRFILIQTTIPNLFTLLFYLFIYSFAHNNNNDDSYGESKHRIITICGATSIISGFLVAFKQLVPEHTIVLFRGRIKFRVKQLPILYLIINTFLGILGNELYAILSWTGFFTSWIYLRFYRISYTDPLLPFNNSTATTTTPPTATASTTTASTAATSYEHSNPSGIKIRGDASESFALSNFFPSPVGEYVEKISDSVYSLLLTLKICTPFSTTEVEAANMRTAARLSSYTPPSFINNDRNHNNNKQHNNRYPRGSARAEAERRRALALKALEQRVQSPTNHNNNSQQTSERDDQLKMPGPAVLPAPHVGK